MGWLKSAYNVVDLAHGGYLPGGHRPLHETLAEGASSAWDVLSGERDYRRQKADAAEAFRLTTEREDNAVERLMNDLKNSGINPMLAGQMGGAHSSAPVVPQSRTAEGVGRIASLAGGLMSGSVNAVNTIAQSGLAKANSARALAEAASTTARLPSGIAKEIALTGLAQAQAGAATATTAKTTLDTEQQKSRWPQFHAEADYYKRYGRSAVMADKLRNPQQAALLVADQAGRGPIQSTINSAAAVLSDTAAKLKVAGPKAKQKVLKARSAPMRSTPYGF